MYLKTRRSSSMNKRKEIKLMTASSMVPNHTVPTVLVQFFFRVLVGKRANSSKWRAKGIYIGAKVVRGRDWDYQDQDGGNGKEGKVTEISSWKGVSRAGARVMWGLFKKDLYRVGFEGKVS